MRSVLAHGSRCRLQVLKTSSVSLRHHSTQTSDEKPVRIHHVPPSAVYADDLGKMTLGALQVFTHLINMEKTDITARTSRFVEANAKSLAISSEHKIELHMPQELSGALSGLTSALPSLSNLPNLANMPNMPNFSGVTPIANAGDITAENIDSDVQFSATTSAPTTPVAPTVPTSSTTSFTTATPSTSSTLESAAAVPPATPTPAPSPVPAPEVAPSVATVSTAASTSFTDQIKARAQATASTTTSSASRRSPSLGARPSSFQGVERKVPVGPLARVWGFGGMAAQLALGTVADATMNFIKGESKSALLSERNLERLVDGLCKMRGAALKIGQMLSIQDESLMSPEFAAIMARVRQSADIMPRAQLEQTLRKELGADWERKFAAFEWAPIAAASIGQVHRGITADGKLVAIKVQYPGVAESINSDLLNLTRLLKVVDLTPKGLYLDQAMSSAREELSMECDYMWEATAQTTFKNILATDPYLRGFVHVPEVFPELTTARVLTSELIQGVPIDKIAINRDDEHSSSLSSDMSFADNAHNKAQRAAAKGSRIEVPAEVAASSIVLTQQQRNEIGTALMRLTFKELFEWRVMQTDPNWANFLYDSTQHRINLIDFGATRVYKKTFVDAYLRMVNACGAKDRQGIIDASLEMGFLTGDETKDMLDVHVLAAEIIGEPFNSQEPYDFVQGNISGRVGPLAAKMMHSRLAAPPMEAYTLHRKLSGAFLTLKRLGAVVDCKSIMDDINRVYVYGPQESILTMPKVKIEKA